MRTRGLVHRAGALFEEGWFETRGENAIVDFKYSASPKLTWWFDHHLSAFMTVKDEETFRRGREMGPQNDAAVLRSGVYELHGVDCARGETKFGMDMVPFRELIYWANIVDGAKYESAKAAVEMDEPAMKLTMVIESAPDEDGESVSKKFIPLLTEMPLQAVLDQPFVQELVGPLLVQHFAMLELIRERAVCEKGVIRFDITDQPTEGYNKFIPYYLFPEGTYNVGLSKSSFRTKVSVGTNPWTTKMSGSWRILRRSASGMEAGVTRAWGRSASRWIRKRRRERRWGRLSRSWRRAGLSFSRDNDKDEYRVRATARFALRSR